MASKPNISQRPLVFFWVATYKDGTALPQYDIETLKPNSINDIDKDNLIKVGWYPFSKDFANKLSENGILAVSNPLLPKFEVDINKNKRFILFTRNFISQEEFYICNNCNKGFHLYTKSKVKDDIYPSPICPYCQSSDYWKCSDCGEIYDKFNEVVNTGPELGGYGHCKKCGGYLNRIRVTSNLRSIEKRWRLYAVGYQQTIKGRNYKTILYIDENGNVEVKYE